MKTYLRSILSLALILALMLSLGVAAFADDAAAEDKNEEEKIEVIDIGFNLCTGEAVAVRMRRLDYDDIRFNGISYKAEAKDGVILIELGDLAVAKILTDKKAEAQEAGIDLSRLYIRGGKALINSDGLSADEVAALRVAVDDFLTANKLSVSIGDEFDLSNGDDVKLKLRVVNFYYPQKPAPKPVQFLSPELRDKALKNGKFDSPEVTTVYIYYEGTKTYEETPEAADGSNSILSTFKEKLITRLGLLGIAKEKNDQNKYYIKKYTENDDTGTAWAEMTDLTEKGSVDGWIYRLDKDNEVEGINDTGFYDLEELYKYQVISPDDWKTLIDKEISNTIGPYTKVVISKDKDKTFREFTFENKTPGLDELLTKVDDEEALAELGYTVEQQDGKLVFTPINSKVLKELSSNSYEITYWDTMILKLANSTATTMGAPDVGMSGAMPPPVVEESADDSDNADADKKLPADGDEPTDETDNTDEDKLDGEETANKNNNGEGSDGQKLDSQDPGDNAFDDEPAGEESAGEESDVDDPADDNANSGNKGGNDDPNPTDTPSDDEGQPLTPEELAAIEAEAKRKAEAEAARIAAEQAAVQQTGDEA